MRHCGCDIDALDQGRKRFECKSEGKRPPPTDRRNAALRGVVESQASRCDFGGPAIQQAIGHEVGRDRSDPPSRTGRLYATSSQPRSSQAPWSPRRSGRRRSRSRSKEAASSKASSEGRGRSKLIQTSDARPLHETQPLHREVPVPGAKAPTVRVSAMVNLLPRWLLKSRCSLSGFLLSIVTNPSSTCCALSSAEKTNAGIWPTPIPYLEVFTGRGSGSGSWVKKLVSMEVVVLSWLHLGCPDAAPVSLRIGTSLTRQQWNVIEMMRGLNADSNTPELVDAVGMGRAALKFEDVDETILALSKAAADMHVLSEGYEGGGSSRPGPFDDSWCRAGILRHSLQGASLMTAKPIDPTRLSFPSPPAFDPLPFVDGATADAFLRPLDGAVPFNELEGPGEVPVV